MSIATMTTPNAVVTAMRSAGHDIAASIHAALEHLANGLLQSMEESRRNREEAYLAESADLFDLEQRMRSLERGPSAWSE
ncbi:DUF3563 family protein [Noviherbaspirillum sp.]|uniref:DUF3563 family protein n=1 Tax=Noviherbaspirillum sp. TaxID=1926288 RepID=UPI0039C8E2AC